MIDFLKKFNKKIEFVLLFLPLLWIYIHLLDDRGFYSSFEVVRYLPTINDGGSIALGYELIKIITWFMPFILWKVISKYWLR